MVNIPLTFLRFFFVSPIFLSKLVVEQDNRHWGMLMRVYLMAASMLGASVFWTTDEVQAQEITTPGNIDGSQQINAGFGFFNFDSFDVTINDAASFVARIVSSTIGPTANQIVLLLYRAGTFDPNNFTANLLSPILADTPLSQANSTVSEGQFTVVAVANFAGDTGGFVLGLTGVGAASDIMAELETVAASLSRISTVQAGRRIISATRNSFVARDRLQSLFFQTPEDEDATQLTVSTSNGQVVGNTFVWAELGGFIANQDGGRKLSGSGVQLGADVAVDDNFVLGFSVGYNDLNARTPTISTNGDFTYIQPYLGYQRGDWSAELSFIYGEADYTQSSLLGLGEADSDVWSLHASVARDYALNAATNHSSLGLCPLRRGAHHRSKRGFGRDGKHYGGL